MRLTNNLTVTWAMGITETMELHGGSYFRILREEPDGCQGMAVVGGKDKTKIRNATPPEFAKLLLSIASTVTNPTSEPASEGNANAKG
jgi:hypothetical protein